MALTLHTDLRLIENWPVRMPTAFDWANAQLLVGEWVRVNADNELSRITDPLTVPDAFPLWSHTGRTDIDLVETIAILRGFNFTATTDRWNHTDSTIAAGDPLMVTGDNRTPAQGGEGGWLAKATSGAIIRAVALGVKPATESAPAELTFRFTEGWTKMA